jgi:hypothetical protein
MMRQPGRDNSVSVLRYNGLTGLASLTSQRLPEGLRKAL